jgi:thiol:disulfide interchange protein DsbC
MKALFALVLSSATLWVSPAWSSDFSAAPASAPALTGERAAIAQRVQTLSQGRVKVDNVSPTPLAHMWMVTSGKEVFYVDASGRYAFVEGRLMDLQTKRDLTEPALSDLNRVDFNALPLDLAIREVHGTGQRRFAVFEDPLCPSCRTLAKLIEELPDVTVYRFMFPVIDPKSLPLAQVAWCAPNRAQAWSALMRGQPGLASAPSECDLTGLKRILALGDELQIMGTPALIMGSGRRLQGLVEPKVLMEALNESVQSTNPSGISLSSKGKQ